MITLRDDATSAHTQSSCRLYTCCMLAISRIHLCVYTLIIILHLVASLPVFVRVSAPCVSVRECMRENPFEHDIITHALTHARARSHNFTPLFYTSILYDCILMPRVCWCLPHW
jgi:hypothetical protein